MMKFTDSRQLREADLPKTLLIEVDIQLLADLMGHRFLDPLGNVISMERLDFHYDPVLERAVGSPMFVKTVPHVICDCGDLTCRYCSQ